MKSFGQRLREAREAAGYRTQAELAQAAGFKNQSTIGNMESGRNKGSRHIAHLAQLLKVNALWLESGQGEMRPQDTPDGRILVPVTSKEELCLELFKKLTPQQQEVMLRDLRMTADANRVTEKAKGSPVAQHVSNLDMEVAYGLPRQIREHPERK